MGQTSTPKARMTQLVVIFLHLSLLTIISSYSYAQSKTFANTATVISSDVDNKDNATQDNNTFATVKSYGGIAIGLGQSSGELQLNFPENVPANRTTFIRIGADASLLNVLLGGNLGSALAGTVGSLVLGNHYFTVGARNASGVTVATGSSNGSFSTTNIKLVRDAQANYYLAVTPTVDYRSVFIKDVTSAVLLGTSNEIRVFNAFHVSGTGNCDPPFSTDYEGTGATLSLLGLGGAGVTNIQNAIDGNPATSSNISLGLIAAAGTISQNIYFNSPSRVGDELNIRLSVSQALANVGLLSNITIEAYNGNTMVYSRTGVTGLLNLDLLGLLNSGQPVTIPFSPNVSFDRVKITLSALLNISLTQSLNIHEVTRSAPRPIFTAPLSNSLNVCYNTTATLGATTAATNELIWYEALEGGSALATTPYNGTYTTPQLTANKIYYVAARQIGCATESVRVPVSITVNPQIIFAATTFANGTVGTAYTKQLTVATGGTPTYTYALAAGSTLPSGLTLSNAGLLGGVPTQAGTYNFSVTVTDSKGCSVTTAQSLLITNTLTLTAANLPDGTVATVYPTQVIPPATGGSAPYTYTAVNLPPGLSFDPATREITGTPTVAGPYVVTINVSDADGNSASMNYTIGIKNALVLPNASLADGTVGISYPAQLIPSATGGTTPYTYVATNLPPGLSFNPTTREITGTPTTTGTFTVNVQVTDGAAVAANNSYTIKVVSPLSIANKTLADGTVGAVYATETLPEAIGGVGPYTYVATNVPAGLSFNPTTRELTGTPTGAGNFTITLTVTDAEGRQATNTYALKVNGALTLATATLPDGTVGAAYPVQTLPAVSGGTGPYIYEALDLPAGLGFNTSTRELTGTPTTGGTYTFSVKVTDAAANTVTTNYQIKVNVSAPLVAAATVCSGTTATLTVTNTQAGVTYNWYGASGSTPLATNNNGSFTTGSITANTIFYVEAVSGTAVSARTAVNVTANPAPNAAIILTNNQTINANQSATLRASADAGNTINWYAQPTGGTALGTGGEFITPSLAVTTTYYAETVSAQGCVSTVRTPVVVTVITGSVGTDCNTANAQVSGTTGLLCVLCNVANPGNAVDTDKNNFTRITLSVGVGATGFQRLIFPTAGLATDSIRLDLATPTGLLDLSVLGGITVNIMKDNAVVRTLQLNSSLVYLQLLGGNRFEATFAAGAEFDRVEVRFQAVVAALSSLDIYGAQIVYPNPTITGNGQTVCYNNSATISAVANGNTQIAWFANATGGTAFATTSSYTTPNLTATTTYYIEVSRNGCPNGARIPVVVNVVPLLEEPTFAVSTIAACEGSPVTLAVENPNSAITYRWYETATGGTAVHTGATYTLSNVTTNKTYYVEAFQQGCTSASRGAVQVTVNPRPILPQVQASVSTINAGQTVVITASSSETNVDFNWFTSPTAATPIFTGSTFVTPPLNTTTSYYVEAKSNLTGCVSSSRVMITITVNNGTPTPSPCVSPVAEENGVNGVALLAGVSNPGLAIDNDTQTASTLSLPVGALGAYVYQRLMFPGESIVGDTIRVLISSPGRLLSLNLLGSVQLSTLRNGTSNNDVVNLNNSLINLELLSGGSQALLTFVPTQIFNQVEVRINGGIVTALNSINVNYAQHVVSAPVVTSAAVEACNNQSVTLSVQDKGLVYKWYNEAGVYQADGATFNTPSITAATKFYVTASSATGCESVRTVVDVTVSLVPNAPEVLANNITTCSGGNAILQVKNPVAGFTYNWYSSSDTFLASGTTYTVTNVTGPATYKVKMQNSCGQESAATNVGVDAGQLDAPIVNTPNVTIRANSRALLSATSSTANAVINWYASDNTSLLQANSTSYLTDPLAVGTYTYYAEAEVLGGCKSAKVPVTVTVTADGTSPVPCVSATVDIDAGVSGVALNAGVFNRGLAVDNNAESASSLVMPVGALGAYVYHRVGFTSLSNVGDTVKVRITSPGKLLSLAVAPSISVLTYNGSTSNNDAMVANNPLINLELLSDGSAATLSFVPTQPFDGVELQLRSGVVSAFTSIDLNYVQRVGAAPQVDATTANACEGSSALLSVKNPVAGITYRWYSNNTYLADGSTYATPTTLTAGTYTYEVRAVVNGCESTGTPVQVTILPTPPAPTPLAGNPTSVCFGTAATLGVNQVAGVTYNWYANGVAVALNSATYTTPANLAVGTHTFSVEAVNGNSCANGNRTSIAITVGERALASDIQVVGGPNVCASTAAVLTASSTTVTNPVFKWYADAALTILEYTGATFTTPTLTSSVTYYVTVTGDNKCENGVLDAKPVTININPPATSADLMISPTTELCGSGTVALTASSSTVVNPIFTWYSDSNLTTQVFVGATYSPNLTSTQTFYVTVKGDNRCESPASQAKSVTVIIKPIATAADVTVAGNTSVCINSGTSLTATTSTVTNPIFTWYDDAALTNVVFIGTTLVTGNLAADKTYYVTVKGDNRCENQAADVRSVTVTVNSRSTAADLTVSPTTERCGPGSVTLTASSTTVTNPVFTWYSDAALTTVAGSGASFTTPILAASQMYYVTVRGDNKCENLPADAKTVSVVVKPYATAADLSLSIPTELCGSGSVTITASSVTVTNAVFTWYEDSALTIVAYVGATFTTPQLNATKTYYVTVKGDNRCESPAADARTVTINVKPRAIAADITLTGNTNICVNGTTTLSATSTTVNNPVFTWYENATLTTVAHVGPTFITPPLSVDKTYYVTVKGDNKCENDASSVASITVVVTPAPLAPVVAAAGTSICNNNSTTLTVTNVQPNTIYEWYNSATNGTLLHTGETFTTPILNANVTYYVRSVGTVGCTGGSTRTAVTVTVTTTPVTPTVANSTLTTCTNGSVTLTVSNVVAGVTYTWYTAITGGTVVGTGATLTLNNLTTSASYFVEASIGSCTSSTRARVDVVVGTPPSAPANVTAAANDICAGTNTVLTVNNPDPSLSYRWYTTATGGTPLHTGTTYTTLPLSATTTFYVEAVGVGGTCVSPTRTSVIVNVIAPLPAPVVTVGEISPNSILFNWTAIAGASSYMVSIDGGANWITTVATNYLVSGLLQGQSVTIIVRAIGLSPCLTSANSNAVTAKTSEPFKDELYIPNTFTPNNDGRNDFFLAYGNNVAKFRMRVYNQWGEFVFDSQNLLQGWDGTYRGRSQPTGVYVYYIDATFNSGTVKTFKGTITLLR